MSAEAPYFPDVEFSELTQVVPPRSRAEKFLSRFLRREPEVLYDEKVPLDDFLGDFETDLLQLSRATGAKLTMAGIDVKILKRKQLIKTLEDPAGMEEIHGEAVLDGIVGNCVGNPEGGFRLNLVQGKTDHVVNTAKFRENLAHEYGHTLGGESHPDPMLEEIKAYAFQALFMTNYLGDTLYPRLEGTYKNLNHHVARNRLNQLYERGFPFGAIIAHITGKPFGYYRPDSNMEIPLA